MTLQSVVQSAALRIVGSKPSAVYSSTDQIAVEMADLVNEVAKDIAASHDWRDLTSISEMVGDGVLTAFPKPDNYDRMLIASDVQDKADWLWGYYAFGSVSEYLRTKNSDFQRITPGGWILLGGQFEFFPAPNGTATFPYISKMIVLDENGVPKPAFTADTDTFILSERVLTLGLIWRYLSQKRLDYSEELATYGMALSQAQTRDKGAQVIRQGRNRNLGANLAWPWPLG